MAVPPDMLSMIQRDRGMGKAAPAAPAAGSAGPTPVPGGTGMSTSDSAPIGAPMSTPEPKMGEKETAAINVQTAMDLLEQSLPKLGGDSDEGKAVMDAVDKLAKVFGKRESKTRELMPTEIMNMISALPQAGGATRPRRSAW